MIYYRGGLPISRSKTLSFNKKKMKKSFTLLLLAVLSLEETHLYFIHLSGLVKKKSNLQVVVTLYKASLIPTNRSKNTM